MEEIKIIMLENYIKIETININLIIENGKNINIKKEDNGKPVILVESKQQ